MKVERLDEYLNYIDFDAPDDEKLNVLSNGGGSHYSHTT